MVERKHKTINPCLAPIYIISGGTGASGLQLVNTVLAQFPGFDVQTLTKAHVHDVEELQETFDQAEQTGGIIIHTLVDTHLRNAMNSLGKNKRVPIIDLMGDLLEHLSKMLKSKPVCRPGLYRSLNKQYYDRMDAIEFSIDHDDGLRPQDLARAEIVLIGVSRVGKTPLAMYLAMQGFKTANVPFIPGQPAISGLDRVDPGRIFGLITDENHLASHRKDRKEKFRLKGDNDYTNLKMIFDELEQARQFFRQKGYTMIDTTDKPLETSADEIVKIITRRFGNKNDKSDMSPNKTDRE
jgi:[pyruvate, water dikinase]-phosphate phosphotransferase / [pyruvate, water dikinase] kinase